MIAKDTVLDQEAGTHALKEFEKAVMIQDMDAQVHPLVSVIITNYNYGKFLAEAIDSVLCQQYQPFELIVVDDGSTDQSRTIMQGYGKKIRSIFKENGGQASAMNSGFQKSRGAIVIFLDADDKLLPGILEHVAEAFRANPTVTKIMYRMEVIDAGGRPTGEIKPDSHLPLRSGDLRQYILNFPFDMTWMATSGNAFSAEVLHHILPIPEQEFPIMADFYLSHLAPLFGPAMFLPEVGAYYRLHQANNFARSTKGVDLTQIRGYLLYAQKTCTYIQRMADELELTERFDHSAELSSISILSKRLTSLKLDPSRHPIEGDTAWSLFRAGIIASWRRFDVSWLMRFLYMLWFTLMLPAPKPVAYWLASIFSFPEKRQLLNKFLGALHHVVVE